MGIFEYILIGIIFGFLFEYFGERLDLSFNFWERIAIWIFWPIVLLITLYYFIKELFK